MFIKDYQNKKGNKGAKSNKKVKVIKEAKNARGCLIRSFTFYYNNIYQIYKETKYSANYWLQELELKELRSTNKRDLLYKFNKNIIKIASQKLIN